MFKAIILQVEKCWLKVSVLNALCSGNSSWRCSVLKPIETKNLTAADVEDLTRDTRELMLRELVSLTAKERGTTIEMPRENSRDGVVKASGAETNKLWDQRLEFRQTYEVEIQEKDISFQKARVGLENRVGKILHFPVCHVCSSASRAYGERLYHAFEEYTP